MPFVKRERTYYKYGTELNATVVGSFARIENGVASGFSASNSLKLQDTFDTSDGSRWEMVYKVTISNISTYQFINGVDFNGVGISINGIDGTITNRLGFFLSHTAGSWDIGNGYYAGYSTLIEGKTYWIKALFNGAQYRLLLADNAEFENATTEVTVNSTLAISPLVNMVVGGLGNGAMGALPFLGTIDLSQSYININGERWWSGDSYTKVGSWIENGVVSGFTASNYLTFNIGSHLTSDLVEVIIPFNTGTWSDTSAKACNVMAGSAFPAVQIYNQKANLAGNGTYGTYTYSTNEDVVWKIQIQNGTGNIYRLDISTNEFVLDYTFSYSTAISGTVNLGYQTSNRYLAKGSIDLTKSYIKINNKDWWHGTKAVESTEDDYDYHVDRNKLYQLAAVKRSYWKYDYQDWTQPTLSANGTLGGDSFACQMLNNPVNSAYLAFDGNTSTNARINSGASSSSSFTFYNPEPLKISTIIINASGNSNNEYMSAGKLYGSNDNSSWTELLTFSGLSYGDYTLAVNSDKYYKYHKFMPTSLCSAGYWTLAELKITAQEQIVVEGNSTDYDYYTDKLLSYAPIVRGKRSYYKQADKQRDTGTYTFTLDKEYTAKLLFVGNGGGGCSSQKDSRWHYSSGGSGACFEGLVRLPADTYTLTIGSLGYGNNANNTHYHSSSVVSTDSYLTNSAGQELIRVGAGGNGYTSVGGVGGAAGVLTLGTLDVLETKKATDGVYTAGNTAAGSVSAYDGTYTGYGAGTGAQSGQGNVYGIKGIFDLVLETDINDYTYYEDVATKIY